MAEGEADVRTALISRLKAVGKHHITTIRYILVLSGVLVGQGRYTELRYCVVRLSTC